MKRFILIAICALVLPLLSSCGGYSAARKVTDKDLAVFNEAKAAYVISHVDEAEFVNSLVPKTVATQVVAGTNYKFNCDKAVVTVYQALPAEGGKSEITSIVKK